MRGKHSLLRSSLLGKLTRFGTTCLAGGFAGTSPFFDGKIGAEAGTWAVYEHIGHLIKVHCVNVRQLFLDPSALVYKVSKFRLDL